ncbi:MAG: BatD family protein, partial [Planctomycetia bacterium]
QSQFYEGESVKYQVTLNHVKEAVKPDMSEFKDFQVKLLQSHPINSRYTQIINGHRIDIVRQGVVYLYSLTPRTTGKLTIPGPKVTLSSGETLVGPTRSLEVQRLGKQDLIKIFLTATPEVVFPTQEFELSVTVAIKALPGELADRDPLAPLKRQLPKLTIPWCDDENLPEGILPKQNLKRWLTDLQSATGTGFAINNFVVRSGFMFDFDLRDRAAAFEPTPKKETMKDASGEEATYWIYEFPRLFVADRPGEFTFGPATINGAFVTGVSEEGRIEGRRIFSSTKPATVKVQEVPTEGRPENYCGAVGRFRGWTSNFNPTKTRVDSPATLTLTLTGSGSTIDVEPLDLATIPEIAENFKTYEGTRQDERGAVKFVYSLRPENEKIHEFPPVSVSYFDVDTGRFETLTTQPIPIEVGPAERLTSSQITGPGGLINRNQKLEANSEGNFGNVVDPAEIHDQTPQPKLWFGVLGGLAGLYIVVAFGTKRYRRLHEDPDRKRRRSAVGVARGRIAEGRKLLRTGETNRGAETVHAALAGLIAAAVGVPESGMTTADACRRLESFGADAQLIADLRELLETCDATRYGGADATLHGLVDRLDTILNQTITTLKRQKRLR